MISTGTGENFFKFVTFPRAACLQVHVVANRQCLMKFLAPVDPSIEYTTNKCFRLTASRSRYVGRLRLRKSEVLEPTPATTTLGGLQLQAKKRRLQLLKL